MRAPLAVALNRQVTSAGRPHRRQAGEQPGPNRQLPEAVYGEVPPPRGHKPPVLHLALNVLKALPRRVLVQVWVHFSILL
jgi:hypothetical protein